MVKTIQSIGVILNFDFYLIPFTFFLHQNLQHAENKQTIRIK